jgi:hypothetical protein
MKRPDQYRARCNRAQDESPNLVELATNPLLVEAIQCLALCIGVTPTDEAKIVEQSISVTPTNKTKNS